MNQRLMIPATLLTVSMMWPSEGAMRGEGLPWAMLWLLAAAFGCWQALKSGAANSSAGNSRWSWGGLIPSLIILAGVWVSTCSVFAAEADRRSALNVAFEWTAIVGAAVLFHLMLSSDFRRQFGRLVIGLALGTAVMGIIQHHVVWAQRSAWYLERVQAIETWRQTETGAAVAHSAELELRAEQVPLEGPAAEVYRRRLLDSTEAIGPFALANTLGGFLAAGIVLFAASLWRPRRESEADTSSNRGWGRLFFPILWMAVISYGLMLTKNRTAWVATFAGLAWIAVAYVQVRSTFAHRLASMIKPMIFVLAAFVILAAAGLFVGAIDHEVVLESLRSFRFRLLYWVGTVAMLKDHWLFGAGPGNFRNAYLKYKLPESSEQILDPHNLILDSYSSAGLIGLFGMVLLILTALKWKKNSAPADDVENSTKVRGRLGTSFSIKVGLLASGLFLGWDWFQGADLISNFQDFPDSRILVLVVPFFAAVAMLTCANEFWPSRVAFQGAMVALVVHLLGAGAFHTTAVGLLLVLLHRGSLDDLAAVGGAAVGEDRHRGNQVIARQTRFPPGIGWAGVVLFSILSFGVLMLGILPVRAADMALARSRAAERTGKGYSALEALDQGISTSKFHVKLRQQKAELLTYQFLSEAGQREDSALMGAQTNAQNKNNQDKAPSNMEIALAACNDWERVDSTSYQPYFVRSQILEAWANTKGDLQLEREAAGQLGEAVARYPTSAEFLCRLAKLQKKLGQTAAARVTAIRALNQNRINVEWGHSELILSDNDVSELESTSE